MSVCINVLSELDKGVEVTVREGLLFVRASAGLLHSCHMHIVLKSLILPFVHLIPLSCPVLFQARPIDSLNRSTYFLTLKLKVRYAAVHNSVYFGESSLIPKLLLP